MRKKKIDKVGYASTLVMAFVFVYLICEIIYKLLSSEFVGNVTWEIVLLVSIVILFGFLTKDEVALNVPRSLLGEVLSLEKKKKKERMNQYLLEGMVVSLLLVVINVATYVFGDNSTAILLFEIFNGSEFEIYNLIINSILLFVAGTIIFYGFNYYICERNINVYTDFMKTIAAQEKELKTEIKETKTKRTKK